MAISSLGIGSGVLTSELVDQLVAVEQEPTENRLNREEEILNAEISEFGALKSLVSDFESAVSSLNLSSSFKNNVASSSDDTSVTGTATSVASPGLYSIEVDQLAQRQTIASLEFSELTDIVGEGTLTFTFGTTSTTVDANNNVTSFDSFSADPDQSVTTLKIDATNHTVSGARDAINAADLGVVATLVDTGSGFRLLIQSEDTGAANGFTIDVANPTNGLSGLEFNASAVGAGLLHTTNASDSEFSINGLNITRENNTVAGVINGVTVNLKQVTSGPTTLSVERDASEITEKVQVFVDSYNELKGRINQLTAFDSEEESGSLFTGDSTVRSLQTQVQSILGGVISSLAGSEFRTLSEVGISTNYQDGLLQFNSSTFSGLVNSNVDGLTTLFSKTGSVSDSQLEFLNGGTNTVAGDYEVEISQIATKGLFAGNATSGSFIVNSLNDTFKINVNGSNSNTVLLNQGSYTGSEMAAHIQAQINADTELLSDGRAVDVAYDATTQALSVISSTFGSLSSVNFTTLDTQSAETLGFYVPGQGQRLLDESSNLATLDTLASSLIIDDSNDDFALTVDGVTSGTIELANATYTDGSDLAAAVQAAINADTNFQAEGILASVAFTGNQANGGLEITFNNSQIFAVDSSDAGLTAALGITTGQQSVSSISGLALTDNFASTLNIGATNDEFSLSVDGTTTNTIQIANAAYTDGASLALAIETAIKADANLIGTVIDPALAATTAAGSTDIATAGLNFSTTNLGLLLNLNGTDFEVRVDLDATTDLNGDLNVGDVDDNLFAIQSALDTALTDGGFSAGDIVASNSGSGLVLSTLATGSSQNLTVTTDGIGAQTASGTTVLAGSEDYSALADATIVFDVDGTAVTVNLAATVDGSEITANGVLTQIQTALNTGLTNAALTAGDVEARLDGSGQVYFYDTVNQTSSDTLSITSVGADDALNLAALAGTIYNGSDGFGLATGSVVGTDEVNQATNVSVTYQGGEAGGGFLIDFGNASTFTVATAEAAMAADLGIAESDGSETNTIKGLDVVGTINGFAASGTGQLLVGEDEASAGIRINILGGPVGDRGSVTFVRGIADQLNTLLDGLLGGSLSTKESGFQRELTQISKERVDLEDRIETFRARLEKQFTFNDILVQQLNSTQDFLTTQFEILNAVFTKK